LDFGGFVGELSSKLFKLLVELFELLVEFMVFELKLRLGLFEVDKLDSDSVELLTGGV
jgi:hypothetical protein